MPPKDMNKPAQCQVPGCDKTKGIVFNERSQMYICLACYTRLKRKGTFEYTKPQTIAECPVCGHVENLWLQGETGKRVCQACYHHYRRRGTYAREFVQRRKNMTPPKICPRCRERAPEIYTDRGWRCYRCQAYYARTGRERPRVTRVTREKKCRNCGRNTENQNRAHYLCYRCRSYKSRNGALPTPEQITQYAPHGWCECGKPAEVQIDLRTGGLLVVPTRTGMTDYLTGTREEYAEWVCKECAGYEDEMQRTGGNVYEPSSYIKRG